MPGDSKVKRDMKKNIPRLIKKGYKKSQAIAIAYSEKAKSGKRKKKRK